MSRVFRQTMQLLEIHQVRSSAYHPESQGALERFHQNLKTMLRCYSVEHERDWDVCLPYVLFAARDSKQESLGFTPFELVYGHTPRGPLKLVKEKWIEGNIEENLLGYVARIKSKLLQATSLAKQHLSVAQSRAKAHFDKSAKTREFKVGDQVLLYLPIPKSPLKAKYYGPYKIKRRVSDVCYVISTPDRRRKDRVCHINLVKPYKVRSTALPISLLPAMDDESPSAIVEFPQPTTRKELRRFLGMAGYYRRFCANFATIAAPLTTLLQKATSFKWEAKCENAFKMLKGMLSSHPVLAGPRFDKPFQLAVDASDQGCGSVLFQHTESGHEQPVSYFSRKFNKHQVNYSTVEKEALGLILSLQHYDVYLANTQEPVTVYTDHNPLTFIHRMKGTNQRVLRWSLLIQQYNLQITHIKGTNNVVADALSRI